MATDPDEFIQLVAFAKPYAIQCGDINGFAIQCAQEVERSGEPAFYLTTRKLATDPKRFPVALEMWGYDETNGQSFMVAQMDITRPVYKDNPHGFHGNHLVVSLLEQTRDKLQILVPEGVEVLTSHALWRSLTHGAGYAEIKAQRALERLIPITASTPKKASRL